MKLNNLNKILLFVLSITIITISCQSNDNEKVVGSDLNLTQFVDPFICSGGH